MWFDVIDFLKTNEDEAVTIMAKVVEQPPDAYKAFMPGTRFFDFDMNLKGFTKSADRYSRWRAAARRSPSSW